MAQRTPVVDSHHHFLDPERAHYPWMTGPKLALKKRFMPEEFRPVLIENGIDKTILVQTLTGAGETLEWLALAERTDFVAGVIGWVDLTSRSAAAELAQLRAAPGGRNLVGVRHKLHDEVDPSWILREDVQRGLAALEASGLTFDLLVRPRELPAALETVRRFPGLRFVIEHIGKPDIAGREIAAWSAGMAPFAEQRHVWCKLSGMVTEADLARWSAADFTPYVTAVVRWFSEDRVMFGSDWPVCLLGGSYGQIKAALETCLGPRSETARARIFGGNAIAAYRLSVT